MFTFIICILEHENELGIEIQRNVEHLMFWDSNTKQQVVDDIRNEIIDTKSAILYFFPNILAFNNSMALNRTQQQHLPVVQSDLSFRKSV